MEFKELATFIYGILILLGGIMGYVKAKSLPSLLGGGILLIVSTFLMKQGQSLGAQIALGATILIVIVFGRGLMKALKGEGSMGRSTSILGLSILELVILFLF